MESGSRITSDQQHMDPSMQEMAGEPTSDQNPQTSGDESHGNNVNPITEVLSPFLRELGKQVADSLKDMQERNGSFGATDAQNMAEKLRGVYFKIQQTANSAPHFATQQIITREASQTPDQTAGSSSEPS